MAARFPKAGLRHQAAGQSGDGWQIVYTGFILIMLCFFIMLTSFASLDPSRITRFVNSFNHAVNVLTAGQNVEEGDAIVDEQVNLLAREDLRAKLFESVHQAARDEGMTGGMSQTELEAKIAGYMNGLGRIDTDIAGLLADLDAAGHADDTLVIVTSGRGRSGFYTLAKPPDEISLLDILLAVDGDEPMFRCSEIRQQGPCASKPNDCKLPCNIAAGFWRAEEAYRKSLAQVDLATLAGAVAAQLGPDKVTEASTWMGANARSRS